MYNVQQVQVRWAWQKMISEVNDTSAREQKYVRRTTASGEMGLGLQISEENDISAREKDVCTEYNRFR